jgi:thiamine pyrophosphokinase
LGVDVSQDHDQESTDFGKAMQKIVETQPHLPQREILILSTLGGRVDQGLGVLHEMLREENKDPGVRLWLLSESSVSFILRKGHNHIEGLKSGGLFTKYSGLVPIYGPATITTWGMEWDIKDWDTQMGTQVSTSNHVMSDQVEVHTSEPILFTIERSPMSSPGKEASRLSGK